MHLWTIKTAWILISWTPWICWCELEVPTIASLNSLTSISWSLSYLKDFPQSHRVWDNEVWLYSILIATNAWNLCRASIKQDINFFHDWPTLVLSSVTKLAKVSWAFMESLSASISVYDFCRSAKAFWLSSLQRHNEYCIRYFLLFKWRENCKT